MAESATEPSSDTVEFDPQDPENPTYEEVREQYRHKSALLPGKQCGHPANIWFRDPRPSPPPARSRKAIFNEYIWKSHLRDSDKRLLTANYVANDDPKVLATETEYDNEHGQMHFFDRLPIELKVMVWEQFTHTHNRLIDVWALERRRERRRGVPSTMIPYRRYEPRRPSAFHLFPESRPFVDPWGSPQVKLYARPNEGPPPHINYDQDSWLTKNDILLYRRVMRDSQELDWMFDFVEKFQTQDQITVCGPASLPQELKTTSMAVIWDELLEIPDMSDINFDLPAMADDVAERWGFLKDNTSLETLYVSWIQRGDRDGIALSYRVKLPAVRESYDGLPTMQVLVDLYDDQELAEVLSLETESRADSRPRYQLSRESRHRHCLGRCLNCERTQWELLYKERAELLWVMTYSDELTTDEELEDAFLLNPDNEQEEPPLQLNRKNSWVQGKLSNMPRIRPFVLFELYAKREEEADVYEQMTLKEKQWIVDRLPPW